MSASVVAPRTQVIVLGLLLVLTVLTVGVSFLNIQSQWHLAAGLTIAGVKAALVVLFFMHAIYSPAATRAVIVVALFWLVGVLLGLTFTDYATRAAELLTPAT
jgi:cytochrome c oxidase subunit IV